MAKIMVLEDEQHLRRLYAEELEHEGHQVIAVGHGCEALCRLQQIPVDLVILDLVLGDGDGLDCLQKMVVLRRDLKVVINTAFPEFKQDFRCWCADQFVVKSSDLSELKTAVQELLDESVSAVSAHEIKPTRRLAFRSAQLSRSVDRIFSNTTGERRLQKTTTDVELSRSIF